MMDFNSIKRIERLKKIFERVAYASLIVDIAIAIVTLISLNASRTNLTTVIFLLNYVLTAIVLISVSVFVAILLFSHYDKIVEKFIFLDPRFKRKKRRFS